MTQADEIDIALKKCGSAWTALDVLRWVCQGNCYIYEDGGAHGSIWFHDGRVEVAHLYCRPWDGKAVGRILERAKNDAHKRGVSFLEIHGRPGWERFLQQKGFDHGRERKPIVAEQREPEPTEYFH